VGGSLSALMHGIILHRLEWSVRILELSRTDTPTSHMAGVCLGSDVLRFLARFDGVSHIPLGIQSVQLQSLSWKGEPHPFLKAKRVMTSWDALYHRLRANFDSFASVYVPHPPTLPSSAVEHAEDARKRAKYETGKEVIDVCESATGRIIVRFKDHSRGGQESHCVGDLVLGADGPNSTVRNIFLHQTPIQRKYAGYVAWRGVIPEDQVSTFSNQSGYQSQVQ
ncbi:hypothetical protein B0J11DRAFT_433466, partial [Dendryphion nanum]